MIPTRRLTSVVALLVAATSTAADLDREIRTETERLQPALVEARR